MTNFNIYEMAAEITEAIRKENEQLKTFNVMVLGKTGIGKSTLINNMFSEKMALTGVGKPVTSNIRKFTKPNFPLAIYDTPGLELKGDNAVDTLLDEVIGVVNEGVKSGDISTAVHCIWYCVSTPSHRFEQAEIDFIKKFKEKNIYYDIPIIVVLTKSYSKKDAEELKKEIEKENLDIVNIVPILAENYYIDEEYTAKAYGLDTLSAIVNNVIPDAVQKTFIAVQKVNLDLKKKRAQAVVATTTTAAAATGATPIPFSDAAVLAPAQIAMLGSITVIFGIPLEKNKITTILSTMIGVTANTIIGKTVVANVLKFIPGVGSVAGGFISGATAATLTAALGGAYISIMIMICKGELKVEDLDTDDGKNKIKRVFTDQLKMLKKS